MSTLSAFLRSAVFLLAFSYPSYMALAATSKNTTAIQPAPALSQEGSENLISQMNAVMNSRLPYRIKSFFEYYVSPTATITKKSILMSPEYFQYEQSVEIINYDRNQYVQSLSKIVTVRGDYSYEATLNSFQLADDGSSAMISWSATEVTSVQTSDVASSVTTYLHNTVYTNCNASITGGSSLPVIANANCIEKIVFN